MLSETQRRARVVQRGSKCKENDCNAPNITWVTLCTPTRTLGLPTHIASRCSFIYPPVALPPREEATHGQSKDPKFIFLFSELLGSCNTLHSTNTILFQYIQNHPSIYLSVLTTNTQGIPCRNVLTFQTRKHKKIKAPNECITDSGPKPGTLQAPRPDALCPAYWCVSEGHRCVK